MKQDFLIACATLVAEVTIDKEDITKDAARIEAATRAVEAFLGKRDDIALYEYDGNLMTPDKSSGPKDNSFELVLTQLMTDEIEPGCKIGCLLVIAMKDDTELYFLSSKVALENAGCPELVKKFDEKYPDVKLTSP